MREAFDLRASFSTSDYYRHTLKTAPSFFQEFQVIDVGSREFQLYLGSFRESTNRLLVSSILVNALYFLVVLQWRILDRPI